MADNKPEETNIPASQEALEKAALKKKEREAAKQAKQEAFLKKQAEKAAAEEARKKAAEEKAKKIASGEIEEKKKKEKTTFRQKKEFVNTTPKGEKKDCSSPLEKEYDPSSVEAAWYDWWEAQGYFTADPNSDKEKFVIVIPPPNVTGALHIGHALTNSIQDAIVRWHRMSGKNTLWVPGTDHAGIATQQVVEKRLAKEGRMRKDMARDDFVAEVWKWKDVYRDRIAAQLKRLGSSMDWTREAFTMDEKLSRAVIASFCKWHEMGLIYRDYRLVNWDCKLGTAISDIEIDKLEIAGPIKMKAVGHTGEYDFGILTEFAYQVEGGGEIVVATTRVETMLADAAVAIHPEDERYKSLHGKFVLHPFNGTKLPIVLDSVLVDPAFGTGAVKITPAHDPNDYECGKRHNLPFLNLLNDDGTINDLGGQFKGLKRYDARNAVVAALTEKGLIRGTKPNPMALDVCSRSGDILEPILKPQWYVRCKEMGERAIKAVVDGEIDIQPAHHRDTWFRWLNDVHDWCISRQLWWGHRIPAYLVSVVGKPKADVNSTTDWVIAESLEEAYTKAEAKYGVDRSQLILDQDPDVLDTWFSSGLFPLSVFGWPEENADLKAFFPTSLLETGQDILFFWVARMVFFSQSLTDKVPFNQVFLHAMVRDAQGRKMSKSLGNVIDPIDVIEGITKEGLIQKLAEGNLGAEEVQKATEGINTNFPNGISECGTDALRFGLCAYTKQEQNINMDANKMVAHRNFCNKLWNATRFALINLGYLTEERKFEEGETSTPAVSAAEPVEPFVLPDTMGLTGDESKADLWILSRLAHTITTVNAGMKNFHIGTAAEAIQDFFKDDFCDIYVEASKPAYRSGDAKRIGAARNTLYICLDQGFRLLHPFMPFVTEELWQHLPHRANEAASLVIAAFPTDASWYNKELEEQLAFTMSVVNNVRSLRAYYGMSPKARPAVIVRTNESQRDQLQQFLEVALSLTNASSIVINIGGDSPAGFGVGIVSPTCEVFLEVKGNVNLESEIARLKANLVKLEGDLAKIVKRQGAPGYANAPANVRAKDTDQLESLNAEITKTQSAIESFSSLLN